MHGWPGEAHLRRTQLPNLTAAQRYPAERMAGGFSTSVPGLGSWLPVPLAVTRVPHKAGQGRAQLPPLAVDEDEPWGSFTSHLFSPTAVPEWLIGLKPHIFCTLFSEPSTQSWLTPLSLQHSPQLGQVHSSLLLVQLGPGPSLQGPSSGNSPRPAPPARALFGLRLVDSPPTENAFTP